MTTETVGGIRVQSMNADRAISRLVERLLRRSTDDTGPVSDPSDASDASDASSNEPRERP
jgi:hypothetical protein